MIEFSNYYFHQAKISRIVERAQIPRGSFYQYFSDKLDLYSYLFHVIGKKKGDYMDKILEELDQLPFIEIIRSLYTAGIKFAQDNPPLAKIGSRFYQESKDFKEVIMGRYQKETEHFLEDLLRRGQERGEIREGVDVKVAAYMLSTMLQSVVDYSCRDRDGEDLFKGDGDFLGMVDKVLYIFAKGISA